MTIRTDWDTQTLDPVWVDRVRLPVWQTWLPSVRFLRKDGMIPRTSWDELPGEVRRAVEERTGPIRSVRNAATGRNSAVALIIEADAGAVFVKGLRQDHPGIPAHRREAAINPYVRAVSATLLWEADVDEWNLLGFAFLDGRPADYRPGSPDVALVVATMGRLAALPCPDLPQLKRAEQRWARYVDSPADADMLAGHTLLHTDYNPDNVLIQGDEARLIDWAWPTRGAAIIDPSCLVVHLVAAGHSAEAAEALVSAHPGWDRGHECGIDVAATALHRMWMEIAAAEPFSAWKAENAAAARAWAAYRAAQGSRATR
jgi:hypothetical protein